MVEHHTLGILFGQKPRHPNVASCSCYEEDSPCHHRQTADEEGDDGRDDTQDDAGHHGSRHVAGDVHRLITMTIGSQQLPHHTKADEEIISRVNKAGKNRAAEITVVSSDQHVQWQCHQAGAKTIESEKFASGMNQVFSGHSDSIKGNSKGTKTPQRIEPKLSQKEVDEWLEIFRERK